MDSFVFSGSGERAFFSSLVFGRFHDKFVFNLGLSLLGFCGAFAGVCGFKTNSNFPLIRGEEFVDGFRTWPRAFVSFRFCVGRFSSSLSYFRLGLSFERLDDQFLGAAKNAAWSSISLEF